MDFDWDSANIEHIARHHVTPEEAEQVITNQPIDAATIFRNGERRTAHVGKTNAGRILFVVVTDRHDRYRVVTARPAEKRERMDYATRKGIL